MSAYKDKTKGTWYVSFRYIDWTGKKTQKLKRGFKTKKEALNYEKEFIRKTAADMKMEMEMNSFIDIYFEDKKNELKENSIRNKQHMMEKHIVPYFGTRKMNEITPAEVIQWQNIIQGQGYSKTYERRIHNQLNALFNHAKKIYNLKENPCNKVKKMGKSDADKLEFWTKGEYDKFIAGIDPGSEDYLIFEILFWTGIREGESLLKKSSGILCERNRLEAYRFIEQYQGELGVRWLLKRLAICPNAYYNYRKHRNSGYYAKKTSVQEQIRNIYHSHNGVDGYRSMTTYLKRAGHSYSATTIHKYMNTQMGLCSIVRPKKPGSKPGKPHKIFENKLKQDFHADKPNQKWCTDSTYLFLKNGDVRYNCTIIDLHDRSVVASITDRHITSELAIRTLQKALESQRPSKDSLILHSDQGSQYTSKAFIEFYESVHVTQSMSKAGYPYDNAPMERYFNTLRNECTNLYEFRTEKELYQTVEEFAYVTYNHVRPHSYNGYRTPFQVRTAE